MSNDAEIVIPYKTLPAQVALFLMLITAPAWALAGVIGGFGLLVSWSFLTDPTKLAGCLSCICISAGCVLLTAVCNDNKLVISKAGISFPLYLLPWLAFRNARAWADLKNVSLVHFAGQHKRLEGCLVFRFYSSGSARIDLRQIPKNSLERWLVALDVWAPHCERNGALLAARKMLCADAQPDAPTYTQLWEEELRRRFQSTVFTPLEAGSQLQDGRLTVVRQLAFGGLSAIYLAHERNHALVVVKEAVVPLTASPQAREKALELFDREGRLMAGLDYPSICKVLDHFVEEDRHYMVLEHIPGQDLRQLVIQHGVQTELKVAEWACEIAEMLNYLHGRNPPIIHRDLTPDNLVLNERQNLVLIDFGVANEFLGTATGTLVGKQAYIPPEQFRGKPSPQSDIYALGATLYFLLVGRDPEPLSRLSLPEGIAPLLKPILERCTEQRLEERYASAEAVADDVRAQFPGLSEHLRLGAQAHG